MNLILTPTMFLPITSYSIEDFEKYLDDYIEFKGFLLEQKVLLYKEQSLEDEIMEQLDGILDRSTKKQLEYKTRLIFQRPTPIDLEQVSNAGDWYLVFDYIDNRLFPEQANGFTGLDIRNIETSQNYQIRFVYTISTWHNWRVYFWKQENIIPTINNVFPNKVLTNRLIIDIVERNDAKKETDNMSINEKLDFFSTGFYKKIEDGTLIELAKQIAIDNNFIHDTNLSNLNSKFKKESGSKGKSSIKSQNTRREIFRNQENTLYLSLDFENFQFEVLDDKGIHQGVWNFKGENTAVADITGNHDVLLKK